ncbi:MAG: type IV pilus modification PilV family protein [Desulfosudaceae bacterium]
MKPYANQNGFSLIEVMIAMAIFAIGILGISSMQTRATNSTSIARVSTEQSAYAVGQMEEWTGISFDALPDGNTELTLDQINNLTGLGLEERTDDGETYFATADGAYAVEGEVDEGEKIANTKTLTLTVTDLRRGDGRDLDLQYTVPRK